MDVVIGYCGSLETEDPATAVAVLGAWSGGPPPRARPHYGDWKIYHEIDGMDLFAQRVGWSSGEVAFLFEGSLRITLAEAHIRFGRLRDLCADRLLPFSIEYMEQECCGPPLSEPSLMSWP